MAISEDCQAEGDEGAAALRGGTADRKRRK